MCRLRIPSINHASRAFIENKRYRIKPRAFDDVVNRNAVSVYQTDEVVILAGGVQSAAPAHPRRKTVRVRRCPTECILRSLPVRPFSALHTRPLQTRPRLSPNPP